MIEEQGITWLNLWNGADGPDGPFSREWGVTAWPSTYLLDAQGRIRHRFLRGEALASQIEALLNEVESPAAGK